MTYNLLLSRTYNLNSLFFNTSCSKLSPICHNISTTALRFLDQRWRIKKGLPMNPTACGVLTDGQDYSYLDGRPTPYGVHQKQRILKQKEIAEKIIRFSKEVDFAVERHKGMQLEEQQRRQQIIDNKLKPKGIALLKKSNQRNSSK